MTASQLDKRWRTRSHQGNHRTKTLRQHQLVAMAAFATTILSTASNSYCSTSSLSSTTSSLVVTAFTPPPVVTSLASRRVATFADLSLGLSATTPPPAAAAPQAASAARPDLPDYGKTSVEVDKIKLEKKVAVGGNTDINNSKADAWRRPDLFGQSLVDQTLAALESDGEFQDTLQRYASQGGGTEQISKEERARRRRALDNFGTPNFGAFLQQQDIKLVRSAPKVLQINIGLYCNQACAHCHVESSPLRVKETMSAETAARCLELLANSPSITTLDITGGAPELNENFRFLVKMARQMRGPELEIIDRCNLTVLLEPGQEDLIDFLKEHRVRIVASLPCYSAETVNQQRGAGVFERSIAALLALNAAGYGTEGENSLPLDLVYNPLGAFLPPEQGKLEVQYKKQLEENFGILFNSLFTITNMPIKRFADFLHRRGELQEYMELLVRNFNPQAVPRLMCVDTISVDYNGRLYDCDFNQQLGYGMVSTEHKNGLSVFDVTSLSDFGQKPIRVDNHCFGCTSGMGSSCQGTTA